MARIIGLNSSDNPLQLYKCVFSGATIDNMAEAVVDYTNTLNLYAIRYKTLINLLQDIILEPPHPWIVNTSTVNKITSYNIERAQAHFNDVNQNLPVYSFEYSIKESIQHSCAAILSFFGAFLGVGHKYGLLELRRALRLQSQHPELWEYCGVNMLPEKLHSNGIELGSFLRQLDRINDTLSTHNQTDRKDKLIQSAKHLLDVCSIIINIESK